MRIVKIDSLPSARKQYVDRDVIMLRACFQILQDAVEKEHVDTHCDYEEHKEFVDEVRALYAWWIGRKEGSDDEDDDAMLLRLMKIRTSLWTRSKIFINKNEGVISSFEEVVEELKRNRPGFKEVYDRKIVSNFIKTCRLQSGMTQKELAEKTGLKQSSVARLETRGNPTWSTVLKVLNGLGLEVELKKKTLMRGPGEGPVLDALVTAHNAYVKLETTHIADMKEWESGMHRLQHLVGMRILRRDYPDVFITCK